MCGTVRWDWHVPGGASHRTWEGCRHALMKISKCDMLTVQEFLRKSLLAMKDVLMQIEQAVQRHPYHTYFP